MLKVVTFDDSPQIMQTGGNSPAGREWRNPARSRRTRSSTASPSHFGWTADPQQSPQQIAAQLKQSVQGLSAALWMQPHGCAGGWAWSLCGGHDWVGADTARQLYIDAVTVMAGAQRLGGIQYLNADFAPVHRAVGSGGISSPDRRVGKAAAARLARLPSSLAPRKARAWKSPSILQPGRTCHSGRCERCWRPESRGRDIGQGRPRRAFGLPINVTDAASWRRPYIKRFVCSGDLTYSSPTPGYSGRQRQDPTEKDFDFTTAVNYKGYFLCVQKALPSSPSSIMQAGYWSDIIQINSKSGLAAQIRMVHTPAASSAVSADSVVRAGTGWRMASR